MTKESKNKIDEEVALQVEALANSTDKTKPARLAAECIRAIKNGENITASEAMARVGYSQNTIDAQQKRAFSSKAFRNELERHGLPQKAQSVVREAMGATKTVAYKGELTETDAPDYKIRLRAAKMLGKWMGLEKVEIKQTSVNVDVDKETARDVLLGGST